jgi:hypothetical protein
MGNNGLLLLIVIIIIISAVVGAIAQFLNRLGEMNTPTRRAADAGTRRAESGGTVRQADRDMDRFLAEIDRLRRKNAAETAEQPRAAPAAVPVARPANRPAERPRSRVVAELAEPPHGMADAQGFTAPPAAPPSPIVPTSASGAAYSTAPPSAEALPVATIVTTSTATSTGAPAATRVTKIAHRGRPTPKTPLARNLAGLLSSGQGVALAVILQEVLGPPKCRK